MNEKNKNYEELDMYEFIRSNGKIKKEVDDYRLHNKNKPSIQKKEISKLSINENKIYGPSEITKEEYEELCMKFANGEKLTKEDVVYDQSDAKYVDSNSINVINSASVGIASLMPKEL